MSLARTAPAGLARQLGVDVVVAGDDEFDAARRVWNADVDRTPLFVARPKDAREVGRVVRFAAAEGLPVFVRGGGHGLAGFGTANAAIVIDLARLDELAVRDGWLIVGGGQTWCNVDEATQPLGVVVTGADAPRVGVGGTVLGGGFGWLQRLFGLTCDSVVEIELVTADGEIHVADRQHEPELFWALRGGGAGLGVATRFRFRPHPLPDLVAGPLMYPLAQGAEVLGRYQQLCAAAPPEIALRLTLMRAPNAPFVPQAHRGKPVINLGVLACGSSEAAASTLKALRKTGTPFADLVRPCSYVELQQPRGRGDGPCRAYGHSGFLGALDESAIEALLACAEDPPSPLAMLQIQHLGGAVADIRPDATAYSHRDAMHHVTVNALAPADDVGCDLAAWTESAAAALREHITAGPYVNFVTGHEKPQELTGIYHPATLSRLVMVKQRYDPAGLFRGCVELAPIEAAGS